MNEHLKYRTSDPLRQSQGMWGGGGGTETASFIEFEPLNVYQSTNTEVLLAALIYPQCSRG
jgi:hypothetical protein